MISYVFKNSVDIAGVKEVKPIFQVKTYDTPFTVPSAGIQLKRYLMSNTSTPDFTSLTNLTLVDTVMTNIIGFYSDDGSLLGFHYTDNFALHYTGYFYADHAGVAGATQYYLFKAYGNGYIRVRIAGTKYILGINSYDTLEPLKEGGISGIYKFTKGQWYQIDVYYYNVTGNAGFSLLWSNSYYGLDKFTPISAGVCSIDRAYKTGTTLSDIISIDREESNGDVSLLKFTVPLVASGSSNSGYYYNTYWDKYCHSIDNITLDKFNLIEYSVGYRPSTYPIDADDLIKKFTGHIESFKPKREAQDYIEIECVGFENLFKQTLNLNYPNIYDYWNAGYAGKSVTDSNPDGIACPNTYDGWELSEAFKSLCIRANIDPYLFLKKRTFLNNSNQIVSGTWLIEETSPRSVVLDTAINYGNSQVVNKDIGSIADDEYVLKSNFGETLFDYTSKMTDVYGWQWGCNPYYSGAPYLKSNNNPYVIYTMKTLASSSSAYGSSYTGSGFSFDYDINTISGKIIQTNTAGDYVDFFFKGVKANLVIIASNDSGAETTAVGINADLNQVTVLSITGFSANQIIVIETHLGEQSATISSIKKENILVLSSALTSKPVLNGYVRTATFSAVLKRGTSFSSGTLIQTTYHSCYFLNSYKRLITQNSIKDYTLELDTQRFYYDGIDPKTNVNPTIIGIASTLSYDDYVIRFTRLTNTQAGSTNYMRIDALMVYDQDTNKISETFYTGDSVVSGTVVALNVEDSGIDLRNDTIVVGRRLGVDVPGSDTSRPINPNNPTYRHIIARATDNASIFDRNAKNYIGMPRQTIQIVPEIASFDRAKYWAIAFINRYRYPKRFPEFEALGHPLIEIGDCISVYDEGKGLLGTNDKFWITGIDETFTKKRYLNRYTTTTYEPWESYTPRPTLDVADFDNLAIINFSITNGGDGNADGDENTTAYDPYSADSSGTYVLIKYDLVVDAYVKIDVYASERSDLRVATLLNPTGSSGPEGWQKQDIGKNYIVTWDGVDLYGDWNKYCTEGQTEEIGKGYYVHEGKNPINSKGKFFVKIIILRRNTSVPLNYYSYDLLSDGYIYTKRANVSSIEVDVAPDMYFKNSDGVHVTPNCCFTDSLIHNLTPQAFRISVRDDTNNSNTTTRRTRGEDSLGRLCALPGNLEGALYGGYGLPENGERNLTNRKIQIKITGYNRIMGLYMFKNKFTGNFYSAIDKDKYCDIQEFIHYDSEHALIRFINPTTFGSYNPSYVVDNASFNNIKADNSKSGGVYTAGVYLGWYIYVEVEARDKSGRRCKMAMPSPKQNHLYKVDALGFWVLWVDDKLPYLPHNTDEPNLTGYGCVVGDVDVYNWTFIDADGNSILNSTEKGIGQYITVVPVWKRSLVAAGDTDGKNWGY